MADTLLEGLLTPSYAYTVGQTLISIEKVSLVLDGKQILRNVNADIQNIERPDHAQGQVICFLGPSGIGKTRLSRIIAGLDQPTTGQVRVDKSGQLRKVATGEVGMVPQNYQLFEYLTVQQNLELARSRGPARPDRVNWTDEMINTLGLREHLQKYPIQLSGGTRQRVAIVRQLLCSEHYLVLDEPFSGLDPIMKHKACALITQIAQMDTFNTIILVTHDVTEGMAVADKVWIMGLERRKASSDAYTEGAISVIASMAGIDTDWLPGATLVDIIDLAAEGICWRPDIYSNPVFVSRVAEVKARFETLVPR